MRIAAPVRLSWILALAAATTCGAEFPEPFDTEQEQATRPQPAAQVAAQMKLPPGFKATVFAAEPDVRNPIALAWDGRGRLWVAENYTYADSRGTYEKSLRDRIVIFSDHNGDGRHDERIVFTDDIQYLTGIEVGLGGVWAICPPNLYFIPDRDGDDVPDGPAETVLDGFTPPAENSHNFANGLRFGPDGWLYGRCGASSPGEVGPPGAPAAERVPMRGGMWRYSPVRQVFEALTSGTTNPWGHDWDQNGELFFINTVNGHLWHAMPGAHFVRPHTIDPNPRVYELIDTHADHWHFDTAAGWSKSRGGEANELGGGHAHIGCMIYQGKNWPKEYRGDLFTLNMHGRRANRERLEREGSGYVARHAPDFLTVDDPWFRGMELTEGPDGGVYVADWCDAGECHERTGVHRSSGRIYKITYDDGRGAAAKPRATNDLDLAALPPHELIDLLAGDAWFVRRARVELMTRIDRVRRSSGSGDSPERRAIVDEINRRAEATIDARLLITLAATSHALPAGSEPTLFRMLRHENEHVRAWGVRLFVDDGALDTPLSARPTAASRTADGGPKLREEFDRLARHDPSALVRLTLASALQRMSLPRRLAIAKLLVSHAEDAADHNLPLMIWYGLIPTADEHGSALAELAAQCRLPTTRRLIARRLAEDVENKPEVFAALLQHGLEVQDSAVTGDLVRGIAAALAGWRKAAKPAGWDAFAARAATLADPALQDQVRELSVLFGDGRALDAVQQIALDGKADLASRKAALQTLIDNRSPKLRDICERLIKVKFLNPIAARGLGLFDDPAVAAQLVDAYKSFHPSERSQLIAVLATRPTFAKALLSAVAEQKIPKTELTAFHARQIHGFADDELRALLSRTWGEFRDSTAEKKQQIAALKQSLTKEHLATADKSNGRRLFAKTCAACHRMFGEGQTVGPDLTGANRDNLDYLLENMIDPSAVVSADFKMSVLELDDGRVLNGLVLAETERTLTLRTATETVVVDRGDVENRRTVPLSLMPENLLQPMTAAEQRDLFGYLQTRNQVPLPSE